MSDWLAYRKFVRVPEELANTVCESGKKLKKLGEGGQSSIYILNSHLIVRTIDLHFGNCKRETLTNLILTEAVRTNINPHFTVTYKLYMCPSVKHVLQVMERFDGDITSLTSVTLSNTSFYIQMLMGILTLLVNDIRLDDVKKENILYKKLPKEIDLFYLVDGIYYTIKTDVIYAFADYGKVTKYSPDSAKDIKNLSDLNSIVKMHKGEDVRSVSDVFFSEFEDTDGICGNPNVISAKSAFLLYGKSRIKLITCVKSKIKSLARRGEPLDVFYSPDTKVEYIVVDDVCEK